MGQQSAESELREVNGKIGQNLDKQARRSGAGCGVVRGGHVVGRQDGTTSGGGGV